jgi:hypothetical protein
MQISKTYRHQSCRGVDHVTVTVCIDPSESFELVWSAGHVNGDEERIRDCLGNSAREALRQLSRSDAHRVEVLRVVDISGESAPNAFGQCIKLAITGEQLFNDACSSRK